MVLHCELWRNVSSSVVGLSFLMPGIQQQEAVALRVDPFYLFWQVIYSGSWLLEYDWKLVGRVLVVWRWWASSLAPPLNLPSPFKAPSAWELPTTFGDEEVQKFLLKQGNFRSSPCLDRNTWRARRFIAEDGWRSVHCWDWGWSWAHVVARCCPADDTKHLPLPPPQSVK